MDSGKWADFAAGDDAKGGDLVSLMAVVKGVNQPEAARALCAMTGTAVSAASAAPKRQQQNAKPAAIVPAPDGVKPPASFKHYRFGEPAATWDQSVLPFTARHRIPFLFAGSRAGAEYVTWGFLRQYLESARKRWGSIVKAHGDEPEGGKNRQPGRAV